MPNPPYSIGSVFEKWIPRLLSLIKTPFVVAIVCIFVTLLLALAGPLISKELGERFVVPVPPNSIGSIPKVGTLLVPSE